jgi:hypothetical protein
MKKNIFILIALFIGSCSPKIIPSSAKVNYVSSSDGTLTMNAIGIGKNKEAAIYDAEKNAFEVLFFRGLPNSEQKIALIGYNEAEIKQNNQTYFQKFYNEGRYKTFLMSSNPIGDISKVDGGNRSITMEIKINVSALRKDLEQYNLIRKFGY